MQNTQRLDVTRTLKYLPIILNYSCSHLSCREEIVSKKTQSVMHEMP